MAYVSGNSNSGKSYQSFTVSEELLAKVTEAVVAGEKEARSSGTLQSFEVFYRGFRQNIAIGRIYIIPASICNDRKDFPTALLYGTLIREFGNGEEMGDMVEQRIGESEFDEYSQADFDTIKEKLFGVGDGKFESLILFAPCWWNKREYITFKFTDDEAQLKNNLRHMVFAVYYDPRLSAAFDAIMTNVNTTKVDVTDITPKMNFPFLAESLLVQYPNLQKQAGNKKKIFLNYRTADAVTQEVLDPQELDVFESLNEAVSEALMPGTKTVDEAGEEHHEEDAQVPRVAGLHPQDDPDNPFRVMNLSLEPCPRCGCAPGEAHKSTCRSDSPVQGLVAAEEKEACPKCKSTNTKLTSKAGSQKIAATCPNCGGEVPCPTCPSSGQKYKFVPHPENRGTKIVRNEASVENLSSVVACEVPTAFETPITNVGPGTEAAEQQEDTVKAIKEKLEDEDQTGEPPIGIAIDETGVPRRREEEAKVSSKKTADYAMGTCSECDPRGTVEKELCPDCQRCEDCCACGGFGREWDRVMTEHCKQCEASVPVGVNFCSETCRDIFNADNFGTGEEIEKESAEEEEKEESNPLQDAVGGAVNTAIQVLPELLASDKQAAITKTRKAKRWTIPHPETQRVSSDRLSSSYGQAYGGGFVDKHTMPPQDVRDYIVKTTSLDAQAHHAMLDHATEIDAGKWGPNPTLKSAALQVKADFIADHIAADFDAGYEVASSKTKKANTEREARLNKLRSKQAVSLDIDSIWDDITEDIGPAPLVDVDTEINSAPSNTDSERSSDGRPRKSDIGKLPEAMRSDEPEDDKAMSDSEADAQEDSMPEPKQHESESESDEEKWHVSSSMEDFVKEAFEDTESDELKYGCDQCNMLQINGMPTHELGCPNGRKTWVPERGWVSMVECPECGNEVEEGESCCDGDNDEGELQFEEPDLDENGDPLDEHQAGQEMGQEAHNEEHQCSNCDYVGPLDKHGRCERCGSESTMSVGQFGKVDINPTLKPIASAKKHKEKEECEKAKETVRKVKDVVKKAELIGMSVEQLLDAIEFLDGNGIVVTDTDAIVAEVDASVYQIKNAQDLADTINNLDGAGLIVENSELLLRGAMDFYENLSGGTKQTEDESPRWIDAHSVNCIKCGDLVDERECIPSPDGVGDICPKCQKTASSKKADDRNSNLADAVVQFVEAFPPEEWQKETSEGKTTLKYSDWVVEKARSTGAIKTADNRYDQVPTEFGPEDVEREITAQPKLIEDRLREEQEREVGMMASKKGAKPSWLAPAALGLLSMAPGAMAQDAPKSKAPVEEPQQQIQKGEPKGDNNRMEIEPLGPNALPKPKYESPISPRSNDIRIWHPSEDIKTADGIEQNLTEARTESSSPDSTNDNTAPETTPAEDLRSKTAIAVMGDYNIYSSMGGGGEEEIIDTAANEIEAQYLVDEYKLAYGPNVNVWYKKAGKREYNSQGMLIHDEDDDYDKRHYDKDDLAEYEESFPTRLSIERIYKALAKAGFKEKDGDLVHPKYGIVSDQSGPNGYLISINGKTYTSLSRIMAAITKLPIVQKKRGADLSGDFSEAKAETDSPDTVDPDIQQPTESVEEAGEHKTATGEMSQEELDSHGREEWPLHYAIADALGGEVKPFDQYQGPYIAIGGDMRVGEAPYALAPKLPGLVRLWISSDDGETGVVYNEDTNSKSDPFYLLSPTAEEDAVEAARMLVARNVTPGAKSEITDAKPKQLGSPKDKLSSKVAEGIKGDISEAKSELGGDSKTELADDPEAVRTVNPDHFAASDFCSKCGSADTETITAAEGQHMYCHACENLTDKSAAAGDNLPEEIEIDLGAGALGDVVMAEDNADDSE